eukprot:1145080-Pelagomonas_calceolata.AAC.8
MRASDAMHMHPHMYACAYEEQHGAKGFSPLDINACAWHHLRAGNDMEQAGARMLKLLLTPALNPQPLGHQACNRLHFSMHGSSQPSLSMSINLYLPPRPSGIPSGKRTGTSTGCTHIVPSCTLISPHDLRKCTQVGNPRP